MSEDKPKKVTRDMIYGEKKVELGYKADSSVQARNNLTGIKEGYKGDKIIQARDNRSIATGGYQGKGIVDSRNKENPKKKQ